MTMKIKFLVILSSILLGFSIGEAERATPDMIDQIARTHVEVYKPATKSYSILSIIPILDERNKDTNAYVAVLNPKGYIVISNNTDIRPVIAYSFESNFDFEITPNNVLLGMVKNDLKNRYKALPYYSQYLRQRNNKLWYYYLNNSDFLVNELNTSETYGPWLDTQWSQDGIFWRFMPIDPVTGDTCIAGCGPVAMGMVINYWEYPTSIIFEPEESYYSIRTDPPIWMDAPSANMDTIDYNGSGVHPTDSTIAHLLWACGISVRASYSSLGTSSLISPSTFNRWDYPCAATVDGFRSNFFDWLVNNMKNRKPAILTIFGTAPVGHYVIADGYRDAGDYHINFGWEGAYDTWYFLPDSLPRGFSIISSAILDISPPNRDATVLRVPSPFSTIQEAIDSAICGDTVLVADGTYAGNGFRDIDFLGKAIIVMSKHGASSCTLDCAASYSNMHVAFRFNNNESYSTVLDGFTIVNGYEFWGGAIAIQMSNPIIRNCVFGNNEAYNYGGAISCIYASPILENNVIAGNTAEYGGGIFCYSYCRPILINNTFVINSASEQGGAIFLADSSFMVILNSIFYKNLASEGDEIYITDRLSSFWTDPCTLLIAYSNIDTSNCYVASRGNEMILGAGNINDSLVFLDYMFHLDVSSPGIDRGTEYYIFKGETLWAPRDDIDRGIRPWNLLYDMGADEYGSSRIVTNNRNTKPEILSLNCHPNPFNSAVCIKYNLHSESNINLEIFDINGHRVEHITLNNKSQFIWKPSEKVMVGVYLIRISTETLSVYNKILYLK